MMSETDDKSGRRPPTIELQATEVGGAANERGNADAAGGPEQENASAAADAYGASSARSGARFTSHILSALLGAVIVAGAAAVLWFAAIIPPREAAPVATASGTPTPPGSTATPPPGLPTGPPAAAAQNSPPSPDVVARLDKIERAIEAQHSDPALGSRIAELGAQSKALGDNVAALTRRVDDIAAASQSAGKQADSALNAAEAAKSASAAASKDQVHREDLDPLARRIMAVESAVKGLAAATAPLASAGANDRAARLTIAAEALRAAVERGAPYQAELTAVQALGVDQKATTSLEPYAASGVPSTTALARELETLVPSLQDASEPRAGDTTFVERLKNNAQKLVRITPLNAPPGNDPQAVLDRIRLDAAQADIGAALSDLNALPETAKPLAAAWIKKAMAREAGLAASRKIAADALAALASASPR